jgi:anti-sigma-K factor RskA
MSITPTPEERAVLAGEYVLGTLDARSARAVERALATDAALRAEVAWWEERLAPLSALATPESPPPNLWARIEEQIAPAPPRPKAREGAERRRGQWFWQGWSLGATAVAAGLAVFIATSMPPAQPPVMAVLTTDRNAPAWIVEATGRGGLVFLTADRGVRAPEGRVLQLWVLPPGATAPTTLGLLPDGHGGKHEVPVVPVAIGPGTLVEMTVEPPGGSPTGRPTGDIAFIGRLAELPK